MVKQSVKDELNASWLEFKKKMTWNDIKALACGILPITGYLYLYTKWMKLVSPLLDEYSKSSNIAITISQHDAILSLCVLIGFISPIFIIFPIMELGFWFGRATRIYKDTKTRSLMFDNVSYLVSDMPQVQRDKINEILLPYKSKLQLKKERLANQSWLRRNFS